MPEKARTKPYMILCYEALLRRLKGQYRDNPMILKDFANYMAGYQGEKYVDYAISTTSLHNAATYRDIRLINGRTPFQIDTLIITPTHILIIEIKNMKGELIYDSKHDQFIQVVGAERKRQRNPIQQSMIQKMHLETWLQNFNLPPVPIETLSVISNPNAIISNPDQSKAVYDELIHVENLPQKLLDIERKHDKQILDQSTRHHLDRLIHSYDTPHRPDLLTYYNLSDQHFIHGIACDQCDQYPMHRSRLKWHCPKCGAHSKNAHEQVIYDYFLLHGPTLTNAECRRYLCIESRDVAYGFLKSMNLKITGTRKGTKYHAPSQSQYPQLSAYPGERQHFRNFQMQ
ncbi:nuclease-related domain-containing protein [Lentibacillus saliphilus]|uniref:nuclease-related domain-containing protein n=1 Tax=Lentibacillus saliphilus TaxID=2737028 RepID=UPI001C30A96A|nr:nuclease-related domain-containing protein [Lentibacillus saliphilus]